MVTYENCNSMIYYSVKRMHAHIPSTSVHMQTVLYCLWCAYYISGVARAIDLVGLQLRMCKV